MCVYYLSEKGFNGQIACHPVKDAYLGLASNFDDFNRYHVIKL